MTQDGLTKVWDEPSLAYRCTLTGCTDQVVSFDYDQKSKVLVSASWDQRVRFYRLDQIPDRNTIVPRIN